ncbi:MAG: ribosome small subunit-dependent GTPase A [Thioploca sp.]|nr:ribosome small subunit-dependent GTPase A [Thioploca sp.]
MELRDIGWNDWFENQRVNFCSTEQKLARIITVNRNRYLVRNEYQEFPATLTGKFRHLAKSAAEYPCVGDWVCIQNRDSNNEGSIQSVLPRKSFLCRKSAGKDIDFQMIGANIDVALIVQSCYFDFNVRRLERYLVMISESHIEPLLILTKIDLIETEQLENLVSTIRNSGINIKIIAISNLTGTGLNQIREILIPGKTYCLIGSSGVGKTTLINHLIGHSELETKTVSNTGEGRHTTVRRQLVMLAEGALLIDTPGMRELGILSTDEGIDGGYADIAELAKNCRFTNCRHTSEPGCAVLKALENGILNQDHYHNYLKIKKESEFYEMSYADKRKKDKDFGKFIHTVMKHNNKRK